MNEQNSVEISKKRESNIELLRIIAMLLIIAHHFSIHGGFNFSISDISINKFWTQFLLLGGKIGVNIFVLISGYFLINVKQLKISKILKLWLQIFTYSIGIFTICVVTGLIPYEPQELKRNLLPITYSCWWFASTYFVLYLIFPYINKVLTQLDKKSYLKLIILTTICWVFIPTVSINLLYQSNALIWFIYLYTISGYIKLHLNNTKLSGKKSILIALLFLIIYFSILIIYYFVGLKFPFFAKRVTSFFEMQKLPIVLISIFLFIGFLNLKIKYNKIINLIASATFGVYLIHDNDYIRNFLWNILFKNATFSNNNLLIPYSLFVIVIVFLVCTIIELFRIYVIEKNYLKFVNKFSNYIDIHFNNFLDTKILKSNKNS